MGAVLGHGYPSGILFRDDLVDALRDLDVGFNSSPAIIEETRGSNVWDNYQLVKPLLEISYDELASPPPTSTRLLFVNEGPYILVTSDLRDALERRRIPDLEFSEAMFFA